MKKLLIILALSSPTGGWEAFAQSLQISSNSITLPNSATAPTCAIADKGKQYFNTTDNKMYFCNGTAWIDFSVGAFVLPYSGSGNTGGAVITLTQNGAGVAGTFFNSSSTNANPVINAVTNGTAAAGRFFSSNANPKALRTEGGVQLLNIGEGAGEILTSDATGNATWQSAASLTDFQLTGNNAGVNKVLTSDATGNATWQSTVSLTGIQLSGSNIGIGTSSPDRRLHVVNSTNKSGVLPNSHAGIVLDRSAANSYINLLVDDTHESGILFGKPSDGSASGGVIYTNAKDLNFRTNSNDTQMTITSEGNVGIGTTTPLAKLEVIGDIKVSRINTTINTTTSFDPYNRQNTSYHVLNITGGSTAFIRGFSAPASGTGTMLYFIVAGNGTAILQDDSATNVADRILNSNSASITISGQGSAIYIYDSGWRLLSFTQ